MTDIPVEQKKPALSELEIEAFRGLRDVKLEQCGWFNLLVGGNNSGKSSVLEALSVVVRPIDDGQWVHTALTRDGAAPLMEALWGFFPGNGSLVIEDGEEKTSSELAVRATIRGTSRRLKATVLATEDLTQTTNDRLDRRTESSVSLLVRGELKAADVPVEARGFELFFSAGRNSKTTKFLPKVLERTFLETPGSHRSTVHLVRQFKPLMRTSRTKSLVELLQLFDAAIVDINHDTFDERETIRVDHKERGSALLSSFGDGVRRAFALGAAALRAEGGLLLIDELETGIHRDMLGRVVAWLANAARELGVQIFATTHSLDAIDAVLDAYKTSPDDFVGYRLRQDGLDQPDPSKRRITPVRLTHHRLSNVRDEGLDLR